MSEIISSITKGKDGLQGLVKMGMESLMKSERDIHNDQTTDVRIVYKIGMLIFETIWAYK